MKTTRAAKAQTHGATIAQPEPSAVPPASAAPVPPLSAAQIKRLLWLEGRTLKIWAAENGYAYSTVSAVMSGKIKVLRNYGTGYEIAKKLGLIVEGPNGRVQRVKTRS
jgi:gp16 family phage-associated protein